MLRIEVDVRVFSDEQVRTVADLLADGAVGVLPTDTVYGLVALSVDGKAVRRVFEIKGRPFDKPLPVQVPDMEDARSMVSGLGVEAERLMRDFWPGPLTVILPRRRGIELPFQTRGTIGLRIPDSPFLLEVMRKAGFLVAPSANLAGEPPPVSLDAVSESVLGCVDFAVDGGVCPVGVESTVVDLTGGLSVVREGAVPADEVRASASGEREGHVRGTGA